jgi:hypothetical protein
MKKAAALEILLLLALASVKADQTPPPPDVGIRIEALPKIATVGDPIQIDLDITTPLGYRVDIPRLEQQVGDFSVNEFRPEPALPEIGENKKTANSTPIQNGTRLHHRARIIVSVFKTGRFSFPSMQFLAITGEGKTHTLSTPPVNIEIRSVLTGKDQILKDLKKQAEIEESIRWALWLTIATAACILGVAGWFIWQKYRKRAPLVPSMPGRDPFELAEADLRDLLSRGLLENGLAKKFYIFLSEIVKRILESGYAIHTSERTTSEIIDSLCRRPGLQMEQIERIESFLLRCDVVKFAKYVPSKAENDAAVDGAFRILAQARANQQSAVGSRQSVVGSGQLRIGR